MKIKTRNLQGAALDWAIAKCEGEDYPNHWCLVEGDGWEEPYNPSTNWAQGGPIIERENITIIRANNDYVNNKSVPLWFAETSNWIGHNIHTSYEGEQFDPCFMIDEAGGCYGPTPLITAMRCFVASKLGDEVEVPNELIEEI